MIRSLLTINIKYKTGLWTPLFKVIVRLGGNEIRFSHYWNRDGTLCCDQPGNDKGQTDREAWELRQLTSRLQFQLRQFCTLMLRNNVTSVKRMSNSIPLWRAICSVLISHNLPGLVQHIKGKGLREIFLSIAKTKPFPPAPQIASKGLHNKQLTRMIKTEHKNINIF